jgi:hypothetical protein
MRAIPAFGFLTLMYFLILKSSASLVAISFASNQFASQVLIIPILSPIG